MTEVLEVLNKQLHSQKSHGMSASNLVWSLFISLSLLICQVIAFSVVRKRLRYVYEPRTFMVPKKCLIKPGPKTLLGWISSVFNEPLANLVPVVGLDAFFFLRFLAFLIVLNCSIAFVLVPTLFPIHYTGSKGSGGEHRAKQFLDRFTIANISDKNNVRYTAHLVLAYVVLFICLAFFHTELRSYFTIRARHIVRTYTRYTSTTLLIKGLYPEYTTEEILREHFGNLSTHIEQIWFNRDYSELNKTIARQETLVDQIELKECMEIANNAAKLDAWKPWAAYFQTKAGNTLAQLNVINTQVDSFQSTIDLFSPTNSCFIKFDNRLACFMAERSINTVNRSVPGLYSIAKVYPKDIIWNNLSMPTWIEAVVHNVAIVLDYAVIFGWAVPVAAVSMVTQVEYIVQLAPSFEWMISYPQVSRLMNSVVAPLALSTLTSQVPRIFRYLALWKGFPTFTLVELDIQKYLFVFLYVQLFLIVTLATGLPGLLMRTVMNTSEGAITLASSLPKATNFFIAYLIASSFSTSGNVLLQTENLWNKLWAGMWALTPRTKFKQMYKFPDISWGTCFPSSTNLGAIALAYAIVSPIILMAAIIAFTVMYGAYKYRLIYTHLPKSTADGDYYPRAIMQLFSGIYCQQVSLLGTLLLVNLPVHAFFAITLILLTIAMQHQLNNVVKDLDAKIPIEHQSALESSTPVESPGDNNGSFTRQWNAVFRALDLDFKQLAPEDREDLPRQVFEHPAVTRLTPCIWLPRDHYGIAEHRVEEISKKHRNVRCSCEGSTINQKGQIKLSHIPPDYDILEMLQM